MKSTSSWTSRRYRYQFMSGSRPQGGQTRRGGGFRRRIHVCAHRVRVYDSCTQHTCIWHTHTCTRIQRYGRTSGSSSLVRSSNEESSRVPVAVRRAQLARDSRSSSTERERASRCCVLDDDDDDRLSFPPCRSLARPSVRSRSRASKRLTYVELTSIDVAGRRANVPGRRVCGYTLCKTAGVQAPLCRSRKLDLGVSLRERAKGTEIV